MSVARTVPFSKKATLDMVLPELAAALAVIVMFAGAVNVAPFAGAVMLSVGAPPPKAPSAVCIAKYAGLAA